MKKNPSKLLGGFFGFYSFEFWNNMYLCTRNTKRHAMTTYELRASIAADLEQMSLEMLENVSRYVKRLRLHPNSAHVEEEDLTPYTVEELLERAEKGRREIAQGNYVTSEEMFRDLFEEFGLGPDEMKEIERQIAETESLYDQAV